MSSVCKKQEPTGNNMKLILSLGLFFSYLILGLSYAWATHIRAGEIIARRVNVQTLEYEFTVVGYTDTRSNVVFGPGIINFGDGRETQLNTENDIATVVDLGNQIEKNTFVIHAFNK